MAENQLRFLSWNIQGLNEEFLADRTRLAIDVIRRTNPHVVFLQEAVSNTERMLHDVFEDDYHILSGYVARNPTRHGDYLLILLKRDISELRGQHGVIPLESAQGPKYYIVCQCDLMGVPMVLFNCHLDSTQYNYLERRTQIRDMWDAMLNMNPFQTVLLGGDTCLRDRDQLDEIGGVPQSVSDVWEALGSNPDTEMTWDTVNNYNARSIIPEESQKRFDRFYIVHNLGRKKLQPSGFEIVGRETLPDAAWHVSDHWGILAHMKVL